MIKTCVVVLVFFSLLSLSLSSPVYAVVPQVTQPVLWQNGSDTVLNITVNHSPEIESHYVNLVEVDINESVQTFSVAVQLTTTFTVQCNLGAVEGTPTIRVRAHCTVDGYSAWQTVGEDGSTQGYDYLLIGVVLLVLIISAVVAVFILRRAKSRKPT